MTKSTALSMKILRLFFVNEASEKLLDQVQPPTETRILRSGFCCFSPFRMAKFSLSCAKPSTTLPSVTLAKA
jgi:hypothetical protein